MRALDLATLLGKTGAAISPEDSWQQRLGESAGDMASAEQDRRFLADLLSGAPDPSGRTGLDPGVVLQGLKFRHKIEQSRPEPVQMTEVETPWGKETMPAEEAPEYKRKVWAEQRDTDPTNVREFEWLSEQPKEVQNSYLEYLKKRRGPNFAESLAQSLVKKEAMMKKQKEVESEIELGTSDHYENVKKSFDDATISRRYSVYADKSKKPVKRETFKEMVYLNEMAKDIDDARDDVSNVRYKRGPEGEGFYGINKDGEEVFIRKREARTR